MFKPKHHVHTTKPGVGELCITGKGWFNPLLTEVYICPEGSDNWYPLDKDQYKLVVKLGDGQMDILMSILDGKPNK